MDSEDEEYHYSKLLTKGKHQTYLPKLEFVELKPRIRRQGKCVGAALEFCNFIENNVQMDTANERQEQNFISNDIWFHIANYIAPEDVQRYALICSQSANSVNSRTFWLQIYSRYCQKFSGKCKNSILQLPKNLRYENIKDCDKNTLRQKVIQALFDCYSPFELRLAKPYSLETLVGRTYISSWYKQLQCVWIMYYKFRLNFPLTNTTSDAHKSQTELENREETPFPDKVVNDWESLVEDESNNLSHVKKPYFLTTAEPSNQCLNCLL